MSNEIIALPTYTPAGGSPINLGNHDAWLEVRPEKFGETIIVHAQYIVLAASPNGEVGQTGPNRATIEAYTIALAREIGLTEGDITKVGATYHFDGELRSKPGVLLNPFTSTSLSGVYPVNFSIRDAGFRIVEMDITFVRLRTGAGYVEGDIDGDGVVSLGSFDGTDIGNMEGFVVVTRNNNVDTFVYTCAFKGDDRDEVVAHMQALNVALNPKQLDTIDTLDMGKQSIYSKFATVGALVLPIGSVSEAAAACTALNFDDSKGGLIIGITATFSVTRYVDVVDPDSDGRVAKFWPTTTPATLSPIPLGNLPSKVEVVAEDAYVRFIRVTAVYVDKVPLDTPPYEYGDELAAEINFIPVANINRFIRSNTNNFARFKGYGLLTGTLSFQSSSWTCYLLEMRSQLNDAGQCVINITFANSR